MSVFLFPECNLFRKRKCLRKSHFFTICNGLLACLVFLPCCHRHYKMKRYLGLYPTGRHSLLLLRSVLALKPPDLNFFLFLASQPCLGFSQCMRVKRSVDFWMAPKKSSKGKGIAAEPSRDEGWESSKCSKSDLESLVKQDFLPSKSVIQWRPALGDARPYENTGEIVGFLPYFDRGLGLPFSNFFCRLLYYYGI